MRGILGELISERHQVTVADMEAGLEHLSRSDGTLRHVDVLLVVLEPYRKALETARRTLRLAADLGIPRIYGVANKVETDEDRSDLEAFAAEHELEVIAWVPYDDGVRRADRHGGSILDTDPDSPAVKAVDGLLDRLQAIGETVGA